MEIEVKCILCKSKMVRRKNKRSGNEFYGCSKFPKCRMTMSLLEYAWEREREGYKEVGEYPEDDFGEDEFIDF